MFKKCAEKYLYIKLYMHLMTKREMSIEISSTWWDISTTKTRYTNKRNSVTASVEIVSSMK